MNPIKEENTATTVVAPVEEAEISLAEYVDGLITALGTDYENLFSGVKNLFNSSKHGNDIALLHLCECYAQGVDLLPLDSKVARRLLDEAALHGNEVARRLKHKDSGTWCLPIIINHGGDLEKSAWPTSLQPKKTRNLQQDSKQSASEDCSTGWAA